MDTLCLIRDIYQSIGEFETLFQKEHNLCLNEGMLLCTLKTEKYSSGEIAEMLGLTHSNTSKVIKSVEEKGLVERVLGEKDKRQMFFSLTEKGKEKLSAIKCETVKIPDILKDILAAKHLDTGEKKEQNTHFSTL